MFDHLNREPWHWSTADRKLSDIMSRYWVNFAKSGNPNAAGLPVWPEFTSMDNRVLYLDDPIYKGGVPNIETKAFGVHFSQARW
jgi:para-nitrobenzyl esterase